MLVTALDLLKQLFISQFVERDAEKSLSFCSRNIHWFGTAEDEDVHDFAEAAEYIHKEIQASPEPYSIEFIDESGQALSGGCSVAQLRLIVSGKGLSMSCRVTATACLEDGSPKICSLHMSVPNKMQEKGEYFPFSLVKTYEQSLYSDLLNHWINGGILGSYWEPGYPLYMVNSQLLACLGYADEASFIEACAGSVLHFIHPDDIAALETERFEQLKAHQEYQIFYRIRRKDQNYIWLEEHGKVITAPDGRSALLGICFDVTAQKEAERKLQESEQRYRLAIEGAGVNVWEYDVLKRTITQSSGSQKRHGYSIVIENVPESLIASGHVEASEAESFREMYRAIERGEEKQVGGDFWVPKSNGVGRWCERICYSVVFDQNGTPIKAYGSSQDVTQARLVEKKYQDELAYWEKVANSILATCRVNLTQRCVEEMRVGSTTGFESRFRNTVDFRTRALGFLKTTRITDEQNRLFLPESLIQQYHNGVNGLVQEFLATLKDNRTVWVRANVKLIKQPDTEDLVAFFYYTDITDKKITQSLVESVVRLDYDYICWIDVNSRNYHLYANTKAFQIPPKVGDDYGEILVDSLVKKCSARDAAVYIERMSLESVVRELEQKPMAVYELDMCEADGTFRRKQFRFAYMDRDAGFIVMTRSDIDDIVKREQSKQDLLEQAVITAEEANSSKSDFMARMSHDMRTPMNAIMGMASLGMDECTSERIRSYFRNINLSAAFLLGLINDILDMAKLEKGTIILHPRPYALQEFITQMETTIRPLCERKRIFFALTTENILAERILVDRLRLDQVFLNLLSNAVKFTPENGKVSLHIKNTSVHHEELDLCFTVQDNGIGMSKEFQEHLFESFSQEHATTTDASEGSGLGLSIAQKMISLMNGTISVTSEKGKGSIFTVKLKVKTCQEYQDQREAADDISVLNGRRVLLCEDHPLNTEIAMRLLQKRGMVVDHAPDGKSGVELFRRSAPYTYDVILMDIRMPFMDGLTAARTIRELDRSDARTTPILAMTANAYAEDEEKSRQAGMNEHLAKPIEPKKLYAALQKYL